MQKLNKAGATKVSKTFALHTKDTQKTKRVVRLEPQVKPIEKKSCLCCQVPEGNKKFCIKSEIPESFENKKAKKLFCKKI